MDIAHTVFQFWRNAKDPINDRLLYEVVAAKDVYEAKEILKQRMGWKRMPRGLTIRLGYTPMSVSP